MTRLTQHRLSTHHHHPPPPLITTYFTSKLQGSTCPLSHVICINLIIPGKYLNMKRIQQLPFLLALLLLACSTTPVAPHPLFRQPIWKATVAKTVRRSGRISAYAARRSGPAATETISATRVHDVYSASQTKSKSSKKQQQEVKTLEEENPEIPTIEDLGPVARLIVGSIQIVVTTGVEYVTGFLGGFILGGIVGFPGLFTPIGPNRVPNEFAQRLARMNSKAVRWGSTWAPISAVYGGCDAAVRVARGNVKDQWNTILSSAAAGAYFSRKGGPQAMLQGAAIYGGLTYLLSGGMSNKNQQFGYKEEAIEF
jgi:hypothetical protein